MYRSCIFCSADLGENDVLELFPVGRAVAFDAQRGRLWAVCPRCARWNLAPMEERWEPVEAAEKLFVDARMRVQSENVGLARMADGTRLIRVGSAVAGELAAWRYGGQLLRRRRRYIATAAAMGGAIAVYGGLNIAGMVGGGFLTWQFGSTFAQQWVNRRVVHKLPASLSPRGKEIIVRRWHVEGIAMDRTEKGALELRIPDAHAKDPKGWGGRVRPLSKDVVVVSGDDADALLRRAMVQVNRKGAKRDTLDEANRLLTDAGSADAYLRNTARPGTALGKKAGNGTTPIAGPTSLAVEMALNEENERRALEGELAGLEAAWREAEEIAAIADALPFVSDVRRILRI